MALEPRSRASTRGRACIACILPPKWGCETQRTCQLGTARTRSRPLRIRHLPYKAEDELWPSSGRHYRQDTGLRRVRPLGSKAGRRRRRRPPRMGMGTRDSPRHPRAPCAHTGREAPVSGSMHTAAPVRPPAGCDHTPAPTAGTSCT
eukprot:1653062-Prymnesium_polylepis.2